MVSLATRGVSHCLLSGDRASGALPCLIQVGRCGCDFLIFEAHWNPSLADVQMTGLERAQSCAASRRSLHKACDQQNPGAQNLRAAMQAILQNE
jgi:hypothetical protein